jgi:hypothetical protein
VGLCGGGAPASSVPAAAGGYGPLQLAQKEKGDTGMLTKGSDWVLQGRRWLNARRSCGGRRDQRWWRGGCARAEVEEGVLDITKRSTEAQGLHL